MTRDCQQIGRRSFAKTAAATVVGPCFVSEGVLAARGKEGANDRLTFAHIGVGGMGGYHLRDMAGLQRRGEVHITAVCDVDEKHLAAASRIAGPRAGVYRDYRYIFQRKDIDAVIIATPDHWHAVQMVHAAQCGQHVYVEKPASCTIEEGEAMVAAARRNRVSVQVGSQGRSQPDAHAACTYIRNGMLGRVTKVTCWHTPNPVGGYEPDSKPPPELDWDLWLGPLPWRPYNKAYCHRTFRWFLESGGGMIRDRGAHVMSCVLYLMNADRSVPVTVEATGTPPTKGLWDCPPEMDVIYTFKDPNWVLVWSQPGVSVPKKYDYVRDNSFGAVYHGEKDTLVVYSGDGDVWTEPKARNFNVPARGVEVPKSPGHKEDWFRGIKTGARTIMNIEAGVAVANLCILGNIAYILGRKIHWDPVRREILGDPQARRLMSRPQRHPYHL